MSKEKENKNEELNESIAQAGDFIAQNKNTIKYVLAGVAALLVIVIGIYVYKQRVVAPKNTDAAEQMYHAQKLFAADSFNVALNGGDYPGFLSIIEDYGSSKTGNLACFYAGVCYMNLGDFDNAITYFNKFKADDELLAARALCNIGDCYVEKQDNKTAIDYFVKAANKSNNIMAATYLSKAAAVYELDGNYAEAAKLYDKIRTDYPDSPEAGDMSKYIERAKSLTSN